MEIVSLHVFDPTVAACEPAQSTGPIVRFVRYAAYAVHHLHVPQWLVSYSLLVRALADNRADYIVPLACDILLSGPSVSVSLLGHVSAAQFTAAVRNTLQAYLQNVLLPSLSLEVLLLLEECAGADGVYGNTGVCAAFPTLDGIVVPAVEKHPENGLWRRRGEWLASPALSPFLDVVDALALPSLVISVDLLRAAAPLLFDTCGPVATDSSGKAAARAAFVTAAKGYLQAVGATPAQTSARAIRQLLKRVIAILEEVRRQ